MSVPAPDAKSEPIFLDEWVGSEPRLWKIRMPGVRFELTRPYGQRVLSPPRLPFRHPGAPVVPGGH